MNSSDTALIKRVDENHEALDGIDKRVITYPNIALDEIFNMRDIVITLLQEFFKKFTQDGKVKYPS